MVDKTLQRIRGFHFGYLVVFALILASFCPLSLGLSCAGIFYPAVADHLNVGKGVLSYYTSFIWIASVITLPLSGRILAKVDARLCISGSILLIALAFVWLSFANSLAHFYFGAFIIGIAVAMLLFLAPSTLVNRWFRKRAGFYVGLIMAFTGVGGVVWSSVGGVLISSLGWSQTYLVFALISLLALPAGIFCVASRPSDRHLAPCGEKGRSGDRLDSPSKAAEGGISSKKVYGMPLFYVVLIICFTLNIGLYAYIMIPSFINTIPLGSELPLLGATASSVAMAGQTISKIVLGYVGEEHPYRGTIIALALGLVGLSLLCIPSTSAIVIYVAAFSFGIYYGVANVMMPIFTRKSFGDKDYSKIYSRISMSASISNIVAALVWGTLIDVTGSFVYMFVGVGILLAATIVLILIMARMIARTGWDREDSCEALYEDMRIASE